MSNRIRIVNDGRTRLISAGKQGPPGSGGSGGATLDPNTEAGRAVISGENGALDTRPFPTMRTEAQIRALINLSPYARTADIPPRRTDAEIEALIDLSPYARTADIPPRRTDAEIEALIDLSPFARTADLPHHRTDAEIISLIDLGPYARTADVPARRTDADILGLFSVNPTVATGPASLSLSAAGRFTLTLPATIAPFFTQATVSGRERLTGPNDTDLTIDGSVTALGNGNILPLPRVTTEERDAANFPLSIHIYNLDTTQIEYHNALTGADQWTTPSTGQTGAAGVTNGLRFIMNTSTSTPTDFRQVIWAGDITGNAIGSVSIGTTDANQANIANTLRAAMQSTSGRKATITIRSVSNPANQWLKLAVTSFREVGAGDAARFEFTTTLLDRSTANIAHNFAWLFFSETGDKGDTGPGIPAIANNTDRGKALIVSDTDTAEWVRLARQKEIIAAFNTTAPPAGGVRLNGNRPAEAKRLTLPQGKTLGDYTEISIKVRMALYRSLTVINATNWFKIDVQDLILDTTNAPCGFASIAGAGPNGHNLVLNPSLHAATADMLQLTLEGIQSASSDAEEFPNWQIQGATGWLK